MAELQFPNLMQSFGQGYVVGSKLKADANESKLNQLSALAMGAPKEQQQGLLSQATSIDRTAGFQLQSDLQGSEDARTKTLVNASKLLTAAPENQRAAIYQQMKPDLARLGLQLPDQYDDTVAQTAQAITQAYAPEASSELTSFNAYTQGLSSEDQAKARRIKLGLDPRAVTGAMKFDTFTDSNGSPRPQRNNPTTGQVEIYVDETGQWTPLGGGQSASQPRGLGPGTYQTPNGIVKVGDVAPEDQEAMMADIAANGASDNIVLPTRNVPPAFGGLGVGQSKAAEAGAVEQAKNAAANQNFPNQLAQEAALTRVKTQGQIDVDMGKSNSDRAIALADKRSALGVYEAAVKGLEDGLSGSTTGPFMGRLPAVTSNQQIAEGGVAAMAPILKQMFRSAGEGTFTDKDQDLLMRMVPTRMDTPASRKAKLANIDRIVRAKLTAPTPVPQSPVAAGRSIGAERRARNPQTGQTVILRNGQWVPE